MVKDDTAADDALVSPRHVRTARFATRSRASFVCISLAAACSSPMSADVVSVDGSAVPLDVSIDSSVDSALPEDATDDAIATDTAMPPGPDSGVAFQCPASGSGAIAPAGACFAFTPSAAAAALGRTATPGVNDDQLQYALGPAPGVAARRQLLVQLNGSGGSPAGQIATPTVNFLGVAAGLGYNVLAVAYRGDRAIGAVCLGNDACFRPTRLAIITGSPQPGAADSVRDITLAEGIDARVALALDLLARHDPGGGWDEFLTSAPGDPPAQRIRWPAVVASGHSQGGGHAALMGAVRPLARVVQLASTCDAIGAVPASWTRPDATWLTQPAMTYFGLAAPTVFDAAGRPASGDTTCPHHAAIWRNLGMAIERSNDAAEICGAAGNTHSAAIHCADNASNWAALLR